MKFRIKNGTKMDNPNPQHQRLVPIGLLIAEGFNLDTVGRRFADQLVIDDAGLRCLPAPMVRAMIDERDQHEAAERERLRRELAEQRARARTAVRKGIPANPGSTALADMIGADRR